MDYIVNLVAFSLPLILFGYWGLVGYATLSLLQSQRNTLHNLLLAPVIGFAITLLLIFWLNHTGLAIDRFALPLCLILLSISTVILCWRRPLFPIKQYLPFVCIFFLALCLTGRPLLKFGFDWVSYGNGDMTFYVRGAFRILHNGFYDVPHINDLLSGKDQSLFSWFMYVPGMHRVGVETILAWVSGVIHLTPLQIYMPVIVGFHLILISTVGALIYTARRHYYTVLLTCLLVSCSALITLGTLHQLIAQVSGLSLLIATVILTLHKFSSHKKMYFFSHGILISVVISALFITYPEVAPFWGMSFVLYFLFSYLKGWRFNKFFCFSFITASVFIIVFLNVNLINVINFALISAKSGKATGQIGQIVMFPAYLLPSGLANLWGLVVAGYKAEPYVSVTIFLGGLLLIFAIIATLRLIFLRVSPPAIMTLVMLVLAIYLFKNNAGFGLYKLAMYIQPFILSVVVISLCEMKKYKRLKSVMIGVFILANFFNLSYYVKRSEAITPGPLTEIAYGSHTKISNEYMNLIEKVPKNIVLITDDFNHSLIKLQELQSIDHSFVSLVSPTRVSVWQSELRANKKQDNWIKQLTDKISYAEEAYALESQYNSQLSSMRQFDLYDEDLNHKMDFFESNICILSKKCEDSLFIIDTSMRSIINKRKSSEEIKHNFELRKFDELKNHLVFTDSNLGSLYFSRLTGKDNFASFFNIEKDFFYPGKIMQAAGQYLLFRIINPTQQFRISVSITNTVDGDGMNTLPLAEVIGENRNKFGLIGRGSARVFSVPISPQIINNVPYIAMDMNTAGKFFPSPKRGLMRLYNNNIMFDSRKISTFVRDISLISEDEYKALNAPSIIEKFPQDLSNNDLEYSGIYEDGWISEDSFFMLRQPVSTNQLIIKGTIRGNEKDSIGSTLTVLVDNKKLIEQKIMPGDFALEVPLNTQESNRRKIELHFDKGQHLPKGDDRITAALIKFIGFG